MAYTIVPATQTDSTSSVLYGVDIDFQRPGVFSSTITIQQEAKVQIKNLLLTYPGERYMNPDFGCHFKKLLFEQNVDLIKQEMADVINNAVNLWLPIINIQQLDIRTAEDDPSLNNDVLVKILFTVGQSENIQDLSITGTETGNIIVK